MLRFLRGAGSGTICSSSGFFIFAQAATFFGIHSISENIKTIRNSRFLPTRKC